MTSRRRSMRHSKAILQFVALALILLSVYFGVQMVQQRQSLLSSASLTGEPTVAAILSFSTPTPPNPQVVGSTFSTNVVVNTAGQAIFGIDANIIYDSTKLEVISVSPISGNGFSSYPSTKFNNNKGEVTLSANIGTGTSQPITSNSLNVATINFKVLSTITSTDITYAFTLGNRNDSNVVPEYSSARKSVTDILGSVTPLTITTVPLVVSPSPSPSPTPTPSPSPSPIISPSPSPTPIGVPLTVTIDLQGKYLADQTTATTVSLSYVRSDETPVTTIPLTLSGAGTSSITLDPGEYIFLIKTPSYLARKYGSTLSPIIVSSTSTAIDLSTEPLLGGDFNNDSVINEIDYSARFLPAFASTDATVDLDGSGQVNNLDFAIMRANWGLTDDTL